MIETIAREILHYASLAELRDETNFGLRRRALESLSIFQQLSRQARQREQFADVAEQARTLETTLTDITANIIRRYRPCFFEQTLARQELRALLNRFTAYRPGAADVRHYTEENLDYFLDTILGFDLERLRRPSPDDEMVHLERTPASVVLELLDRVTFSETSLFLDLGSGVGHVIFLVALLSDVRVAGVEIEAAYYAEARRVQQQLALPNLELVHADVRAVDLERGTVFFLFSPFTGGIMADVLQKLRVAGQTPSDHGLLVRTINLKNSARILVAG